MFDGLSGMDWVFIAAALALGFGVVKFMLVQKGASKADAAVPARPAVPSVRPGGLAESTSDPEAVVDQGQGQGERSGLDEGPAWFDVLGVPRSASEEKIHEAFQRRLGEFAPQRLTSLMMDLKFIGDGQLEASMSPALMERSKQVAVLAEQLRASLEQYLYDLEGARDQGLMRRRQGRSD